MGLKSFFVILITSDLRRLRSDLALGQVSQNRVKGNNGERLRPGFTVALFAMGNNWDFAWGKLLDANADQKPTAGAR